MILSVFSLLMFDHSVFAKANSADQQMSQYIVSMIDNERTPVKVEELPDPVKNILGSDAYKEWTPSEAFLVKGEHEYYEITIKKEAEVKILKLNKEGIVVE